MYLYRQLPSVDALLNRLQADDFSHDRLVMACREALNNAREQIRQGNPPPDENTLIKMVQEQLQLQQVASLRPVINATGVIIHTNLGRAPLSPEALQSMQAISGYSTLEYQLETGQRGKRDIHIESLITEITGAEAALVVNNNAAAVYLALSGLAFNQSVVLSRSELVEIGGGFRMPDVMSHSGCHLVEVGTTNRTRLQDFANAIAENTALFMRVHSSNFKIIGFTETVPLAELAQLAHDNNIHMLDDLGSGALLDTAQYGLEHEPTVQESLAADVDLVTFSGDKLLGGPQAGIIAGRQFAIDRLKKHPLARALRPDKLCLAGLTTTLNHYRYGEALEKIPVWQMIAMPLQTIEQRAQIWQRALGGEILDSESTVGGGSLPGNTLPTRTLALKTDIPENMAAALRGTPVPIIGRIQNNRLLLDPRTVLPDQDAILIQTIQSIQNG